LETLEVLNLTGNPLQEVPECIFEKMTLLSELYLQSCQLSSLPNRLEVAFPYPSEPFGNCW